MGKKRVAKQSAEAILKDSQTSDDALASQKKSARSLNIKRGRIYIRSSYNNLMLTITDEGGNVLSWASSGASGFKGPKKATPFAASKAVEYVFERLGKITLEEVIIMVSGIGGGRDAALRAIVGRGLNIVGIRDITPIPHNGCRPAKSRRV